MDARQAGTVMYVLPKDHPYLEEVGKPIVNACRILHVDRSSLARLMAVKMQRPISPQQLASWEDGGQEIPGVAWLALRDLTREPVSALLGEVEMFEGLLDLEERIADLSAAISNPR